MVLELIIADDNNSEEWDRIVESSSHGTIYHTWKWLKIIEKNSWMGKYGRHSKSKLFPIMALKGEKPVAIFPLFYYKYCMFNFVFSPPAKNGVNYLGAVIRDYDLLKQNKKESIFIEFQSKVDDFISNNLKADYTSIILSPNLIDSRPFVWNNYDVTPKYSYIIELSNINDVWNNFKSQLRRNIRATEKKVLIEKGSKVELEYIFDNYKKRSTEQKLYFTLSKEYLFDLYDTFAPINFEILVAKYQDEIVGGIILTNYKDKVSTFIGTAKTDLKGIYPNDLLIWRTIEHVFSQGYRYCELEWANTKRLNNFKSKYNPDLTIYLSTVKYNSYLLSKIIPCYNVIKK